MAFPLVGRDKELSELQTWIEDAAAGHGSLILVGGESGIGKTALMQEAFRGSDVLLGLGRCLGPEETPPFGPWMDVVQMLGQRPGGAHLPVTADAVEPRDATGRGDSTSTIGQTGATAAAAQLPRPFGLAPGEWRMSEVAGDLFRWLCGLGRSVCIVIEDMQWADAESMQLLRLLAPRLGHSQVLIAVTYRSDELDRNHPLWSLLPELQRHGAHRMTLERLNKDAVVQLAAYAMPGSPGVTRIAEYLHGRTAGHPFFVCELLSASRTSRVEDEESPLPETVQQAIDQRLHKLSGSTEAMLDAAAVLGERFEFDLLSEVADLDPGALDDAVREALSVHLIRSVDTTGKFFTFDHALIREQVLQRLVGYRRRRLHERIAVALMGRASVEPDVIAIHLYRAGDARAPLHLKQAGDAALRLGAFTQAAIRYERALETLATGDLAADALRAEVLLMYGVACQDTDLSKALTSWKQAREVAERIADEPVSVWAQHMLAMSHYQNGDHECLHLMEHVQQLQERWLDSPRYQALEVQLYGTNCGLPRIIGHRALALTKAGREAEASVLIDEVKRRATTSYRRDGLLHIEYWHAILTGQTELSVDLGGLVTDRAIQQGNVFAALQTEGNRLYQILRCKADRPEEVDAVAARVRQLCLQVSGNRAQSGAGESDNRQKPQLDPCPPLGWYAYLRGDWADARHHLLGYLAEHPTDADPGIRGFAALLQFASGDFVGAKETLAVVPPFRPDHQPILHTVQISAYSMRADLCLREGDFDQAFAWLTAADRFLEQRPGVTFQCGIKLTWARYYRMRGDLGAAYREATTALTYAQKPTELRFIMMACTLLGEIAAEMGDLATANNHLTDAITLADRCRYPYYAAVAKYNVGAVNPRSEEALAGMLEAERTLVRLGVARHEYSRLTEIMGRVAMQEAVATFPVDQGGDGTRRAQRGGIGPEAERELKRDRVMGADRAHAELAKLTRRELDVLEWVAQGLTDKQVAAKLFISPRTVDNHLRSIFAKLGVTSRTQLVNYAVQRGFTSAVRLTQDAP